MGSHFVKTGLGNDVASAQYFNTPQQAFSQANQNLQAAGSGRPNFLTQRSDVTLDPSGQPGYTIDESGAIPRGAEQSPLQKLFLQGSDQQLTAPGAVQNLNQQSPDMAAPNVKGGNLAPSFLSQPTNLPKIQTPSFLQAENNPQVANKAETKMGKLFQILSTVAAGGAAGAGAPTVGQGFAQAQHSYLQRKEVYNQQQQQLIQNQRQAQADKNSQAEADRQAAEAPLNTKLKQQTIQANDAALQVKNQTPDEIQAQRAKLVKDLGLTGDVAKMVMVTGKPPEDFGKRDDLTPYQKAQLDVENQRLGFEAQRVKIEGQKAYNDANKKDTSEQAIERAAQSLANGDLTRLKDISSMRSDQRLLIYDRAKQLNPQFNTAEVDRKIKMVDEMANGKDGQNLQSFGTFLEHAGEASDIVNNYRLSNSPLMNKSLNWIRKNASADPAYQQYVTSLEPVRKEFEGFLLGGRALYGDDRKAAETILSDDATPAQQQAALKQMGHTAKARYNEINHRYKRTVGSDIPDAFSPEAIEGARKIGVDLGKTEAPANDPFAAVGGRAH